MYRSSMGLLLAAALLSAPALALDLETAEQAALAADPELAELAARARALDAEAVAAGQLPDPKLSAGMMNLPLPELSPNPEPMAQAQLGISQRFPSATLRRARTSIKHAEAQALQSAQALRRLEVVREVRTAFARIQHLEAMLTREQAMAETLDRLTETLDTRQRLDRAYQTAVLSSQARRARIEKQLADRRAAITEARAALAERLDPMSLPQRLEPAEFAAPEATPAADHPAIRRALEEMAVAEQEIAAADAGYRPGWEVSLGLGRRFGDTPMGAPSDTLLNATVAIDLPIFTSNRQDKRLEAARARHDAAATGPGAARRHLEARAHSARTTHADYQALAERYRESVVPLAAEQEESAAIQYRTGRGEQDPVLEARLARLQTEIERIELELARDRAAIELMYLGGQ